MKRVKILKTGKIFYNHISLVKPKIITLRKRDISIKTLTLRLRDILYYVMSGDR